MLTIRFTKLTDARHRIEFVRADGTREAVELETRSFLLHDLIHYAVESEAGLTQSFYGALAAGKRYGELSGMKPVGELAMTEAVVAVMTNAAKGHATPAQVIAGLQNLLDAHGDMMPSWLTEAFAERALERLRRLQGQWKATRFGETMELTFG
ncbi:MAG: hypothetical protein JNK07_06330 [Alphaproteobacteria bacterium]|nr:hypothetical protein [Alphaproteobacteria bacterium]